MRQALSLLLLLLVGAAALTGQNPPRGNAMPDGGAAAFARKLDAALEKARPQVVAAKTPAEMDGLIQEFSRLAAEGASHNSTEARDALSFLTAWQDFLQERATGNPKRASERVRKLADLPIAGRIVPRSEILARSMEAARLTPESGSLSAPGGVPMRPSEQVEAIVLQIKGLADLPAALQRIERIVASEPGYQRKIPNKLLPLKRFAELYERLQAKGDPAALLERAIPHKAQGEGDSHPDLTAKLRREFLLLVLPLALQPQPPLPPTADELPQDYVGRVLQTVKTRKDWREVARLGALRVRLEKGHPHPPGGEPWERPPFSYFFAAQNYEKAGQRALAVRQYLLAMRFASPDLPVDLITERLQAIEREDPTAYAEGRATPPPAPTGP